ncbi:MAG: guanylate kinase [Patescibacteria group bacterium]|mgnify:FL=1
MADKNVVVIGGPTGSGESTITKMLLEKYPHRCVRLVTATTRSPRGEEKDGIDYYFFSKERFLAEAESGGILEYGYVPNRDTYYGTYGPDLKSKLDQGYIVITNLQIVGTKFYKQNYNATTIYLMPGSMEELRGRLLRRNPDMTPEDLAMRLQNAEDENRDEKPFYDHTVVNADGKLDEAFLKVEQILIKEGYNLE